MAQETQWSNLQTKLKRLQTPTTDDLQKYSAANLDPWTVQLGQVLCDRFQFAPLGHRNLANVLHSLPGHPFKQEYFEIGFGSYHIIHVLLRTPEGLSLVAITGILAEYFHEDFVVDFFTVLAKKAEVPLRLRPLEDQWRRLIRVLYGVLATSTFGQVLTAAEALKASSGTDIDLQSVLTTMDTMSKLVRVKKKNVVIPCGPEISFLAAAATWLFDVKYKISTGGSTIHVSSSLEANSEPDIAFDLSDLNAAIASPGKDVVPSYRYPANIYIVGGRVPFEGLFKLTFGSLFTSIKNDTMATYLACAAKMMQDHLDKIGRASEFPFLPHNVGSVSGPGFGFIDTMMGWFPELNRLSSRLSRLSKITLDDAQSKFRESFAVLKETCECPMCERNSAQQQSFCSLTVVESVISLGLYVTRMIVQPGLYPKAKGVRMLAKRLEETRISQPKDMDPVESFMVRLGRLLPTSVDMLKMGASLFAVSASKEIDAQVDLMGITHAGLTIFLSGGGGGAAFWTPANMEISDQNRNPEVIRIVPGWMCIFGHVVTMEVYSPSYTGWTFENAWQKIRRGLQTRQLVKWQGSLLLSAWLPTDEKTEEQAESEGWIVLED